MPVGSDLSLKALQRLSADDTSNRLMAENGFAPPPPGNFADISYLVEN